MMISAMQKIKQGDVIQEFSRGIRPGWLGSYPGEDLED